MNKLRPAKPTPVVLASLADDSTVAALKLLADLCRQQPDLRDWLWAEFARDAKARERFGRMIDDPAAAPVDGANGFAQLTGEDRAWRKEREWLRRNWNGHAPRIYGGLTWSEMEKAVRHYEAGTLDLGTFLLAHDWCEANKNGKVSPELMRASVAFLDTVTRGGQRRLLKHFYKALSFLRRYEVVPKRRSAVGYTEWWKLRALFFMLGHPRASYRTRDLRAHLAALGLEISSLDFRRFCARHGIRRDERAGRPRRARV